MKSAISSLTMTLCFAAASTALAAEQFISFDPLTVKAGEEMRITLFNPSATPILLRVFAYDAAEGSYDEGVNFILAPGKIRFFDFKTPKDFIGLGGVIETTPNVPAPPSLPLQMQRVIPTGKSY